MDPERYVAYYRNQAGNGLPGYAGGLPLLKRVFSIAKPHLKTAARNIASDIVTSALSRSYNDATTMVKTATD